MTLVISKGITLAKGYPNDPDVLAYIAAVQAADESASPGVGVLEIGTVKAIDDFVTGCKADGIWSAIKASCILAGARTLTGALVPLVGTAPTNVGGLFVSGDYNRKTGLVGNGTTKHLNSNRNNNADPQNSKHHSVYLTIIGTGIVINTAGAGGISGQSGITSTSLRANNGPGSIEITISTGFTGVSRSLAGSYAGRASGSNSTSNTASQTPLNENVGILGRVNNSGHSSHRIAFYSIGESLNLALLDARVTDLINAFGAAIP
jgi:hypothetical protein